MFAVIRTGGKQYRVVKDDKIVVEKLVGDPGALVELSDVLMIGGDGENLTVGSPVVDKAAVFAEVIEQSRANKILVFKKNRRKNYRRTKGHRQEQTVLKILDVSPLGVKPKISVAKAKSNKDIVAKKSDEKSDKKNKAKKTVNESEKTIKAVKSDKKIETKAASTAKLKSAANKPINKSPKSKE
jgi:large subunit ribosomal protein L21